MRKEKGFTLVELLIVIVVIGILAGMMMLSSTEAITTARANDVINNLNQLKKATLAWYADNRTRIKMVNNAYHIKSIDGNDQGDFTVFNRTAGNTAEILKYVNQNNAINICHNSYNNLDEGKYFFRAAPNKQFNLWYVGYIFSDKDARIREKVAGRASSLGLLGGRGNNISVNDSEIPSAVFSANDKIVFMFIIETGTYD